MVAFQIVRLRVQTDAEAVRVRMMLTGLWNSNPGLNSLFFFEGRKISGVAFGFDLVGRNEAQARRIHGVALSGRRSRVFEKMAEV